MAGAMTVELSEVDATELRLALYLRIGQLEDRLAGELQLTDEQRAYFKERLNVCESFLSRLASSMKS